MPAPFNFETLAIALLPNVVHALSRPLPMFAAVPEAFTECHSCDNNGMARISTPLRSESVRPQNIKRIFPEKNRLRKLPSQKKKKKMPLAVLAATPHPAH